MNTTNKNRTWTEISLTNLIHNFNEIRTCVRKTAPDTKVLSVVKADAYGHGATQVARELAAAGSDYFATATVPEAVELRESGITQPILILGYVDAQDIPLLLQYDIAAALCDLETAQVFSEAATAAGKPLRVHIALNTGMTRIGFETDRCDEDVKEIIRAISLPGIQAEGIFTHFAVADTAGGEEYTEEQFTRFYDMCQQLDRRGYVLPYRHCANSGAILQHPETFAMTLLSGGQSVFNMVRAGIILYGYYPDATTEQSIDLRPVMTVKAHVVQVRDIPSGVSVSYGRTYCSRRTTRLAVVTMGYEDGYLRTGSGHATMLVQNTVVPVVGRICMDMCMLDVTGMDVKRGDIVTVFGEHGVTADTVAQAAGTISYEVLCAISKRIPRFYYKD